MAETVADVVIGVSADIDPLMRATSRAGKAMNKFGSDMSRDMGAGSRNVVASLGQATAAAASFGRSFVSGLAIGAASAGLAVLTTNLRSVIGGIADMADQADRVGLTTDQFQGLAYGMKLAGVQADEFSGGLAKFTDNIGDAARGSGTLKDTLEANGIALRNADGSIRATSELLGDFADMISRVPDEATRMSLITEAFGRGGTALTLALSGGRAGLAQMQADAVKTGAVIDADIVARARDLDDKFDALTTRIQTFFMASAVGWAAMADDMATASAGVLGLTAESQALNTATTAAGSDLAGMFGPEVTNAIGQNSAAMTGLVVEFATFGANVRQIRGDAQAFGDEVSNLSSQLYDLGQTGAASQVERLAGEIYKANEQFDQGQITGQQYLDKMRELNGAVQGLIIVLGDVEGADFSAASQSAAAFEAVIVNLGNSASRAYQKIRAAMGLSSSLDLTAPALQGPAGMSGGTPAPPPRSGLAPINSPRPNRPSIDGTVIDVPGGGGGGGGGGVGPVRS